MTTKRYLAAIMFTDLDGFSRLANTDEAEALDLIEINRFHQRPLINSYGTFVKEMGDGLLGKFKSALDAVACAIEIQKNVPDELKNRIRIGIHWVIFRRKTLMFLAMGSISLRDWNPLRSLEQSIFPIQCIMPSKVGTRYKQKISGNKL